MSAWGLRFGGGSLLLSGLGLLACWPLLPTGAGSPGPCWAPGFTGLCLGLAVAGIQTDGRMRRSKTTWTGAGLLLLSSLGLLVLCQQPSLAWPVWLGLVFGGGVYTAGFSHVGAGGWWPKRAILAGLAWALLAGLSPVGAFLSGWPAGWLAWTALGYVLGGAELGFWPRQPQ